MHVSRYVDRRMTIISHTELLLYKLQYGPRHATAGVALRCVALQNQVSGPGRDKTFNSYFPSRLLILLIALILIQELRQCQSPCQCQISMSTRFMVILCPISASTSASASSPRIEVHDGDDCDGSHGDGGDQDMRRDRLSDRISTPPPGD